MNRKDRYRALRERFKKRKAAKSDPVQVPCFFCEAKFPSREMYTLHAEQKHYGDLHEFINTTTLPNGQVSDPFIIFQCYYCTEDSGMYPTKEDYLLHLEIRHPDKSWAQKDNQETKSEEDWRAYINKPDDEDDAETSVDDKVIKKKKTGDGAGTSVDDKVVKKKKTGYKASKSS